MSFVNPLFLVGLAAVALPVLIHLLIRDRVKRVAFSTLRFFVGASTRILRRRKFQEALLLALRIAVCALAALAFARPFFSRQDSADGLGMGRDTTARVIVADVSASMSRPGLTAALREQAAEALAGLREGSDAAALVLLADTSTVDTRLSNHLGELRPKLAALQPGHGGTDIVAALKTAAGLLDQIEAGRKEIVLLSDFQKCGWRGFRGDWKLPPDVHLLAKPLEPAGGSDPGGAAGNVAIAQAECPTSMVLDRVPRYVAARLANYSPRDLSGVEVELALGDKKIDSQRVNLRAGATADVRFRHVFDSVGDNPGTITVKVAESGADSDASDNAWFFNARVSQRIRVVILSGQPAADSAANAAADAAMLVRLALAPTADAPFAVSTVAAASAQAADLNEAAVVVLCNVDTASPPVREALAERLRQGGGLLFLPGDRATPDAFNRDFADLAPARLRRIVSPAAVPGRPAVETVLTKIDYTHPIFRDFARPHHGDLSLPRFARYWEVSYLELGDPESMRVPARFDDGDRPAIVERRIARGASMLVASPADLGWNNFALRAVFLPFLHESIRYLAMRGERPTAYRVGEPLPVAAQCQVKDPGGQILAGERPTPAAPGFYTEVDADGKPQLVFAVNRDPAEADPTPLSADRVVAAVQAAAAQADAATAATPLENNNADRLWWYLILAVAGLSLVELRLANKTLRH
jgi:hypothetical protein